jgi:formylmethanofuran dehydrogenase subunit B
MLLKFMALQLKIAVSQVLTPNREKGLIQVYWGLNLYGSHPREILKIP